MRGGILIGLLVWWGFAGVAFSQETRATRAVLTLEAAPAPDTGGQNATGAEAASPRDLQGTTAKLAQAKEELAKAKDGKEVEGLQKQIELLQKQIEALQRTTQALADQAKKQAPPPRDRCAPLADRHPRGPSA